MTEQRAINGVAEMVEAGLIAPESAPALAGVEEVLRIRMTAAMKDRVFGP